MRSIITILILSVIISCNPDGLGCFESSGQLETISISVPNFTSIDVSGNIDLQLSPETGDEVLLTTGKNLAPGIKVEVIDGVLYLDNLNKCNWSRKYLNPVVEITNNAITRITTRGYGKVESIDTLNYDLLKLINEGGSADFNLVVNIRNLEVVSNDISNFFISGIVDQLAVGFYYNDGIFYGQELQAKTAVIKHYGSNSIHINVIDYLNCEINSLGNVIIYQQLPLIVEIEENSTGKLIFKP